MSELSPKQSLYGYEDFMGEIKMYAYEWPPKNWATCTGQLLAISTNQALFSLLGTTYGGDGVRTFGLPDLRGRTPINFGTSSDDGNYYTQGQAFGTPQNTLLINQIPNHAHQPTATMVGLPIGDSANTNSPDGAYFAENTATPSRFSTRSDASMAAVNIVGEVAGGNQPHNNMQPYLVINFCILLYGVFPSRN